MRLLAPLLLPAVVALGACATGPQEPARLTPKQMARLDKLLEGKVPGKPVNCVSNFGPGGPNLQAISDNVLVLRESARRVYKNELNGTCHGISRGDILVLEVRGSQYCRGDIARVISVPGGFMGGSCVLGDFVPYTSPKPPRR